MSKRLTSSPVTIVWLGSSSTAGNNASAAENRYVNKTMAFIRAAYPLPSGSHPTGVQTLAQAVSSAPSGAGIFGVNAGISGSRSGNQNGATPYISSTTRNQIAALNPRVLVHMIGANDYGNGVPVATYKSNLQNEIAALDAAIGVQHVHVLIHTYPRFDSAALTNRVAPWADYLTALKEIAAAATNVVVTDNSDDWARQGVTGAAGADPWDYIDTDEIHMNDQGHDFMADILRTSFLGGALVAAGAATTPPTGTAPTITTTSLNSMTVGVDFSQTITYTGDTSTVTASGLPAGLSISSAGVISGKPTTAGTGNVTFTATNSTGNNSKTLAYTVSAAPVGGSMNVLYSDSFDRANSTTVGSSATDRAFGGSAISWQENAAAWQITDNTLAPTGVTGGQFLAVGQADYEARGQIAVMPTASGTTLYTIDARRSTVTSSGATQYRLYLRSDGSAYLANGTTSIATAPAGTFAVGDWVGLRMKGTAISIVKATSATDVGTVITNITNTGVTNATGFAGFSRINSDTTGRWNAFAVLAVDTV
jgi:lysophospholipase L1-like esterase